jgi:hypothetical protein
MSDCYRGILIASHKPTSPTGGVVLRRSADVSE